MSDREQLAARLVEAADRAMDDPTLVGRHAGRANPRGMAAVVAVLRELGANLGVGSMDGLDLSGLADYIEKGAAS